MSGEFAPGTSGVERPIIAILGLLAVAFAVYLLALRAAIRTGERRELMPVVVFFAVSIRLPLLFSDPILEVDIYRYLWDGQATIHGVSPFQYSPQQVLDSSADQSLPPDLARLVNIRDSSPAIRTVLNRVHFSELTTVYPPVSQGVFALAALTTPSNAGLSTYLVLMKAWIVLFDLATIWLLIRILRLTSKPIGWLVAYAWCPLVLKEFDNSGHLDSIAVCLTTLAVYLMLRAFYQPAEKTSLKRTIAASVILGLAVGAKLYPVVLSPLLILVTRHRLGSIRATCVAAVFLLVAAVVCWPLVLCNSCLDELGATAGLSSTAEKMANQLFRIHLNKTDRVLVIRNANTPEIQDPLESHTVDAGSPSPPIPPGAEFANKNNRKQQVPGEGLKVFLSRWKMNDFLFLLLIENLTPMSEVPADQRPWFVVTPENWRQALVNRVADSFSLEQNQVPFILARTLTALLFLILAGCFCWRAVQFDNPSRFLEAVFLTLAWFWLLLPTQNPWYWIWALPFLPFAHNRAWLVLSGLSLLYYLRFWLAYHWPNPPMPFTTYSGEKFFDFVVIWIEFGPWFIWLAFSSRIKRYKRTDSNL